MMKKTVLLALVLFFTLQPAVFSQATMKNNEYMIRMGNLNTAAGKPTGTGGKLNLTLGQTAPGLYTGTNFKVRAGFQYISSIIPFSFSISQILIDFGTLSPTNPVTRQATLTVSNQSAGGYVVTAVENHELLVPGSGAVIPDTTCDGGTCTQSASAEWSSTLTYGFGYRCDAVTTNYCASGFTTANYYKQFANTQASETPQVVMSGTTGRTQQSVITYKANVSSTQAAGQYSNQITYVATPTY